MKGLKQKEIIIKYVELIGGWIPVYKLRSVNTDYGWIGSQGDRRVRELVEQGIFEHRINGKYAEIRFKDKTITSGPVKNKTDGGHKLFEMEETKGGPYIIF